MTRRVFTGALSEEIARAEGRGDDRARLIQLQQAARGMLALIRDGLVEDGAVRLHRFGTFRLKAVAARRGINPRTGEPLVIAAHRRVVFAPAKALLERIEPLHPAPLPAVASAPVAVAPSAAHPAACAGLPARQAVGGLSQLDASPGPRRPERHWMAAAALLAALAVLVILLLPPAERGGKTVAVSDSPAVPAPPAELAQAPTDERPRAAPGGETRPARAETAAAPAQALAAAGTNSASTPQPLPAPGPAATARSPVPPAPSAAAAKPYFAARPYAVAAGDSLWRLSERHYAEPILWPHIYRANQPRLRDPDLIYRGEVLTLPELQGAPETLSAVDRERIAEGYYLVYRFYEAQRHPDAIYALLGVRWFDSAVYERHRDDLSRQRLRIMELSPLYGDRVPRLLAATFNPFR